MLALRGINTVAELHDLLQTAFSFSDYYGRNWDALWECPNALAHVLPRIDLSGCLDACARVGWRMNVFWHVLTDFCLARTGPVGACIVCGG